MTDPAPSLPPAYRDRFGVVRDGDDVWGYLHVFHSWIDWPVGWRGRKVRRDCLVMEQFRTLPPRPTAIDWADELGLSDSIIHRDEDIAFQIDHLNRSEFAYPGRALRIDWADESESEEIRKRYFAASSW